MTDAPLRDWLPPAWLVPPSALATGVVVEAASTLAGAGPFAAADVAETTVAVMALHAVLAAYAAVRRPRSRRRIT